MTDHPNVINIPRPPKVPGFIKGLGGWGLVVVLLGIWLISGAYQVEAGEVAVVRRFGRALEQPIGPGLHWHVPWPVERVDIINITVQRIEVGFRTINTEPLDYVDMPEESLMLTKDENIVSNTFTVQYRVGDPIKFLFNIEDPEGTIRAAAESAMRATVGSRTIDDILTTGKSEIQLETTRLLQDLMYKYDSGILVDNVLLQDVNPPDEVVDAFKEVASAREEKQRLINEAQSYQNDVIPKARGEAQKQLREAEAFRAERVERAEGDAQRFKAILAEYRKAPAINRTRMYLEVMEQLLPGMEVYVVDAETGGIVPYLPLKGGSGQ